MVAEQVTVAVRVRGSSRAAMIVHADDFGESVEITRGIAQGIAAGVVTSTSVMANMPGTAHALSLAATLADRASFGVHLNLCEGAPLTVAPSLVDERGQFHRKRQLIIRSAGRRLSRRELHGEIAAQIETVASGGLRVSHVDGHKHLHQLPQIKEVLAEIARTFGIERVRVSAERNLRVFTSPGRVFRELAALRAARTFRAAGLRSPSKMVDVKDFMATPSPQSVLFRALTGSGLVEMFCHPGTELADSEKPGSCRRHEELEFLLSPAWRAAMQACGLRLATWWEV